MYEVRRATGGTMAWNWAGTDIGKAHHHTVVLNNDGEVLLSRKVVNDEADLLHLISEVLTLGETVVWSVDVADGMASCWSTSCSTMDRPSSICPASP